MNNKYEFTGETTVAPDGTTLHRIRAKITIGLIASGTLGGFVQSETNLSVEGNAWVYGNARVYGNAQVYGNARVYGNAQVYGDAQVYGNARVYGDAQVYGNARVYGNAQVYGNARVYGNAQIYGNARVYGDARVKMKIICATRTDGYTFVVTPDKSKAVVIIAGCRYFTFEESRNHWRNTRGSTPLGEESLAIVDHLERMARIQGWLPKSTLAEEPADLVMGR